MQDQDHDPAGKPRKRGAFARTRANFLTGVVVVAPIAVTLWLIWTVIGWIDGWVLPFVPNSWVPDFNLGNYVNWNAPALDQPYPTGENTKFPGFGVVIFLVFTVVVGWLTKGLLGRTLLHWGERIVDRMPVVRSVYNGLKQIAETVFAQTDTSFEHSCLIEYPRKGIWSIGFISTQAKGEIRTRVPNQDSVTSVFLPTTPNPTSGYLLFVPTADVIVLDMTVEDAAKLVISAGLVYPSDTAKQLAQAKKSDASVEAELKD
ncbi:MULTISPECIES: DUF502 domain-containing protein [Falsihalocynthiibacter]|uniref:DUF502 domain-containing protein n=1 Tax=Falsihalocynthiibacter TaxID=2854182 RepID=UPI003001C657